MTLPETIQHLPVRIQLSRAEGFRLAEQAPDGRPIVNVARPSKWGNPYVVGDAHGFPSTPFEVTFDRTGGLIGRLASKERALLLAATLFRVELDWLVSSGHYPNPDELRGKHLACWCALPNLIEPCPPCHATHLLAVANGWAT